MRARIEERRELEVVRGTSLVGPHRDEVAMVIGGLPARTHASHGEGWLAALALTLGSLRIVADAIGEEPVLLLDDPFTLLDPERRARLVGALPRDAQILVTAADPAEIPVSLDAARVEVENLRAG